MIFYLIFFFILKVITNQCESSVNKKTFKQKKKDSLKLKPKLQVGNGLECIGIVK